MTEIIRFPPSPSSNPTTCITAPPTTTANNESLINGSCEIPWDWKNTRIGGGQLSVLAVFETIFKKSFKVGCSKNIVVIETGEKMEIGRPSNVRHVAHVTFDRFNGFLGLPVEFEPEVPRRPPSASTRVFGVSTESMQLSFDSRGNCVPTILLMMQRRLYSQGGLQSEGIFRINPSNGQEEYVRGQLNNGLIPDNIDVHCLAGLIKAWFRELPRGILDCLSPDQVMRAQSEDECTHLVRLLPPTEAALLDWTVNLMADVAQLEHLNKMNTRNIAMVFAPNMTQMSDPLTALMHAVQVMNFLKTLIVITLREREDSIVEPDPMTQSEPSNEDHHDDHIVSKATNLEEAYELGHEENVNEPHSENKTDNGTHGFLSSMENILPDGNFQSDTLNSDGTNEDGLESAKSQSRNRWTRTRQQSRLNNNAKKGSRKYCLGPIFEPNGRNKDIRVVSDVNSQLHRGEAWR